MPPKRKFNVLSSVLLPCGLLSPFLYFWWILLLLLLLLLELHVEYKYNFSVSFLSPFHSLPSSFPLSFISHLSLFFLCWWQKHTNLSLMYEFYILLYSSTLSLSLLLLHTSSTPTTTPHSAYNNNLHAAFATSCDVGK